jgi:hypothetical protein
MAESLGFQEMMVLLTGHKNIITNLSLSEDAGDETFSQYRSEWNKHVDSGVK